MITEEQSLRFRAQWASIEERFREGKVQAGDAEMMAYSRQQQEEYGISPYGRLVLQDGSFSFVGGPRTLNDVPRVKPKFGFNNLGKIFATTGTVNVDYKPAEWADVGMSGNAVYVSDLEKVSKHFFFDEVVLQNPSQTMIAASRRVASSIRVIVKDREAQENLKQLSDLIVQETYTGDSPVFCGASLPMEDYNKWFALVPNPYYDHLGTKVSLVESPDKFSVLLQRRGKEYHWNFNDGTLADYDNVYVYSPHQLASYEISRAHFIVSNFDMNIVAGDTDFLFSAPRYLPLNPLVKFREDDLLVWKDRAGFVYDVKELRGKQWVYKGTYYSRRARLSHLNWVGYQEVGRPVSFFSQALSGKRIQQNGSWFYCGRFLLGEVSQGEEVDLLVVDNKQKRKMRGLVSPAGILKVVDFVPAASVVYDSEYDYATSQWLIKEKVSECYAVLQEDQTSYGTVMSRQALVQDGLKANLELEIGSSLAELTGRGATENQLRVAGYVEYNGKWYRPEAAVGTLRAGMMPQGKFDVNCDSLTYSEVFSSIFSTLDRRKRYFVGQQLKKMRALLLFRGIVSYVSSPGTIYVIK